MDYKNQASVKTSLSTADNTYVESIIRILDEALTGPIGRDDFPAIIAHLYQRGLLDTHTLRKIGGDITHTTAGRWITKGASPDNAVARESIIRKAREHLANSITTDHPDKA